MKILFFLLIISFTQISIFGISSANELTPKPIETLNFFHQIEYRDSNGKLFAFLAQPTLILKVDPQIIHDILDTSNDVQRIDGFDILNIQTISQIEDHATKISIDFVSHPFDKNTIIIESEHDGIIVFPGDSIVSSLLIIRHP